MDDTHTVFNEKLFVAFDAKTINNQRVYDKFYFITGWTPDEYQTEKFYNGIKNGDTLITGDQTRGPNLGRSQYEKNAEKLESILKKELQTIIDSARSKVKLLNERLPIEARLSDRQKREAEAILKHQPKTSNVLNKREVELLNRYNKHVQESEIHERLLEQDFRTELDSLLNSNSYNFLKEKLNLNNIQFNNYDTDEILNFTPSDYYEDLESLWKFKNKYNINYNTHEHDEL